MAHGRHKAPIVPSGCSSGVERNLAKVDVVGSNPIIRSIFCLRGYCNPLILQSPLGSRLCDIQSYYMVLLCTVLYIDFPVHSRFKTANTTTLWLKLSKEKTLGTSASELKENSKFVPSASRSLSWFLLDCPQCSTRLKVRLGIC